MAVAVYTSLLTLDEAPGGTVTVQDAGTTSSRNIYTDTGLSVAATNPIPLDSSGRATQGIIYTAATAYKVIVKDSAGTTLYTRDNIDPGIPLGTGKLAIANGGTGADDAAEALSNLGAATAAELASLASSVAALAGAAASSEKTQLAVGTTAQRPASPAVGQIRHNTTTTKLEHYISAGWDNLVHETANAASTANVSGESSSAVFVKPSVMKYHPGIAKAWARVTFTAGTPAYTDSWGFDTGTAITDHGAGEITLTFSTAMANANYATTVTPIETGSNVRIGNVYSQATGSVRVAIRNASGSGADPEGVCVIVHGDL